LWALFYEENWSSALKDKHLFKQEGSVRLCDFGSCSIGTTYLRTSDERSAAEEIIQKETTPMYRAPEMVDLYLRQQLTEKTDIWVRNEFDLCIWLWTVGRI
jgi:serine/threonine protein kinase